MSAMLRRGEVSELCINPFKKSAAAAVIVDTFVRRPPAAIYIWNALQVKRGLSSIRMASVLSHESIITTHHGGEHTRKNDPLL